MAAETDTGIEATMSRMKVDREVETIGQRMTSAIKVGLAANIFNKE